MSAKKRWTVLEVVGPLTVAMAEADVGLLFSVVDVTTARAVRVASMMVRLSAAVHASPSGLP